MYMYLRHAMKELRFAISRVSSDDSSRQLYLRANSYGTKNTCLVLLKLRVFSREKIHPANMS